VMTLKNGAMMPKKEAIM